jgi:hypothetical protein
MPWLGIIAEAMARTGNDFASNDLILLAFAAPAISAARPWPMSLHDIRQARRSSVFSQQRILPMICRSLVTILSAWFFGLLVIPAPATACPFCSATQPSLCERIELTDVACVVRLRSLQKFDDPTAAAFGIESWQATYEVQAILRGGDKLGSQRRFEATVLQRPATSENYLLLGAATSRLDWSQPIPVTSRGREYLQRAVALPHEGPQRLEFFLGYLNDAEKFLREDAYTEFAKAPFDAVRKLKHRLDRRQVIAWLVDPNASSEHFGLYFTLLSICGTPADARMLARAIRQGSREGDDGFDSLIACYLTLAGEAGLKDIGDWLLASDQPPDRQPRSADVHAAVVALRFHGEEQHVFQRSQILPLFRRLLDQPSYASLVIADLARWEDWDALDRLVRLFVEVDEQHNIVRTPIVQYLLVCPRPEARQHLERLAEIAPRDVERAKTLSLLQQRSANRDR